MLTPIADVFLCVLCLPCLFRCLFPPAASCRFAPVNGSCTWLCPASISSRTLCVSLLSLLATATALSLPLQPPLVTSSETSQRPFLSFRVWAWLAASPVLPSIQAFFSPPSHTFLSLTSSLLSLHVAVPRGLIPGPLSSFPSSLQRNPIFHTAMNCPAGLPPPEHVSSLWAQQPQS